MKKVLIIILVVLLVGAGIGGTLYFYMQNNEQVKQNEQLAAQNAQIQASLDVIGLMTNVYQVKAKVFSGDEIKEEDLIAVSVPESTLGETGITDLTQLVGKYYKIDTYPGTPITTDLVAAEQTEVLRYTQDLSLSSLPVDTVIGDYIDVRILMPTGDTFPVLTHKKITDINGTVVSFEISEEQLQCLNSALIDYGLYGSKGVVMYVTKYINPGLDTDVVAFYPVQASMETIVTYNPNISDPTRCINSELRKYIDAILVQVLQSDNTSIGSAITSVFNTQQSAVLSVYTQKSQSADEVTISGTTQDTTETIDQNVGEAITGLEEDLSSLEEMIP